jgi:hypothetical protein
MRSGSLMREEMHEALARIKGKARRNLLGRRALVVIMSLVLPFPLRRPRALAVRPDVF